LTILEQALLIVAIPSTLILLIQTVMLIFGSDAGPSDTDLPSDVGGLDAQDSDIGADESQAHAEEFDASGVKIFTIRGIIAFLSVGGWAGVAALEYGAGELLAMLIAFLFGSAALYLIAKLVQLLMKLQSIPSSSLKSALGQMGEVYVRIPPAGKGTGKVSLEVNGQFSVFDAITEGRREIKTGHSVQVVDIVRGSTMVVEPSDRDD